MFIHCIKVLFRADCGKKLYFSLINNKSFCFIDFAILPFFYLFFTRFNEHFDNKVLFNERVDKFDYYSKYILRSISRSNVICICSYSNYPTHACEFENIPKFTQINK